MNKGLLKKISMFICAGAILSTTSCSSSSKSPPIISSSSQIAITPSSLAPEKPEPTPERSIYIYNSKGENAEQFTKMAQAYAVSHNVKVKDFSIGVGQDHMETLREEMRISEPPTIFSCQGLKELDEWKLQGMAQDLTTLDHKALNELVNNIPPGLRLTYNGKGSYGIPYNVEGYGYIVDTMMLGELFGLQDTTAIVKDIQLATYPQWEEFVTTVTKYIANPSAATVTLNQTQYKFSAEKTSHTQKLTGVFAVMGAERWTYGDHFVNVALNAAFRNPFESADASTQQIQSLTNLFEMYAKALDFKTSNMAGLDGAQKRDESFISPSHYNYAKTLDIFVQGKALFIKQGNWFYSSIEEMDAQLAQRLVFLPVKMPFTQDIITVDGLTVEQLNSSIPVFVPNYYVINAKASDEEKRLAADFLVWMNTSQQGQKFVQESFAFIPYNAKPDDIVLKNSLGNSILNYIKEDKTLGAPYHGISGSWSSNIFGAHIMDNYMAKGDWSQEDYSEIAQFGIKSWTEQLKTGE